MKRIRLVLADDHMTFLESMAFYLANQDLVPFEILRLASSGQELLLALEKHVPDVILLDLNMPEPDGLQLLPELKSDYPDVKVIALTMYDNPKFIKDVFDAGGDGYLLKSCPLKEVVEAIAEVFAGKNYMADGLRVFPKGASKEKNGKYFDAFEGIQNLTKRELEVLTLISEAKSNKDIAGELFISDQTVGVHRKNIMRKLNISNTAGLIKFALDHRLVQ